MNNKFSETLQIVLQSIEIYSKEIGIKIENLDESTRLIGSTSVFDSSDLVQIIVEIEEKINDYFNCEIILTDEKAMSRTTSPFLNAKTLAYFIVENLS